MITLGDLPVGACWKMRDEDKLGFLLKDYEVIYSNLREYSFRKETFLDRVPSFVPVELV